MFNIDGSKIMSTWPTFPADEIKAAVDVLISGKVNYWTGDECRQFETEFAIWSESKYAIALANGTLALELALHALEIGPGDEVIVTPRTFIASISSVITLGATPIFADVDLESGNITADSIAKVLTKNTKAIICVHLAGWPCDMDPIMDLAKTHNLRVIEDCAQAHGARYKGRSVGSIGDIGAWSFCQDKIMSTAGEGGMVTTNNDALWSKMWAFKDHGKSYQSVYGKDHPPGFRWLHESFGSNYRMIEIQGAIGRIQLKKMAGWTSIRNSYVSKLLAVAGQFSGFNGILRAPVFRCLSCQCGSNADCSSACIHAQYKCYVYVRPENLAEGWTRDRMIQEINDRGIPCYQGSCSEVYLEMAFDGLPSKPAVRLPNAKVLGETSLMFLVHPTLTKCEISKACNAMKEVFSLATK
jgi:dTDP-4-amino-4,6-dideoxygalactose transaminase